LQNAVSVSRLSNLTNLAGRVSIPDVLRQKLWLRARQVAHYVRNAARWGVQAGNVGVDLPAILQRKNEIVESFRSGWQKKFDGNGNVKLYRARARFVGLRRIQAGNDIMEADRIFIDTGAKPTIPKIDGLESVPYLTNASLLELEDLPAHLLVLGGGYVGLEFGQMFRRFGSEVTIIQSADRILPNEDGDITEELQGCLEAEGIRFLVPARATRIRSGSGSVEISVETSGGQQLVKGTHLLVATGRTPRTIDLDLRKAGVEADPKGFIKVNERLETTAPGIWAIGDVTGGPAFTHISYNDFQIVYGNIYEGKNLSTAERVVPYAVYTDPALGRVGLTEKAARQQGKKLKIGRKPLSSVACHRTGRNCGNDETSHRRR
jgi:pyruvate/2-oxoglutarate dehydrogenase complex dihydrolipoamide dehydrogenase (E3) component